MNLPYQDPALPQAQPTDEDLVDFQSPVENMPAGMPVPEKPSKGMSFDFSVIDVQTQEEYEALPPVLKQLRHEIVKYGKLPSPEQAAAMVDKIQTRLDAINSPQAKATLEAAQLQAEKTKAELKAAEAETRTKANEKLEDAQKTYQRASNMVWLLDNLRGGTRDKVTANNEKWRTRVGSVDGRWPSLLSSEETLGWNADFASLKGMINLEEAQKNRGQGALSDGERALMAQAASLGLEKVRDEAGFAAAFERMYDLAVDAQQKEKKKLLGDVEIQTNFTPINSNAPQAAPQGMAQPAAPLPLPQFQSREQVMQAVNAGQITREQGVQALRAQFGNQFR